MSGKTARQFLLLWPLCSSLSWCQGWISGRVTDAQTQNPLEAVNIFLSNTILGTTTAEDGDFLLTDIPPGKYDLIISMIGYSIQKREVQIDTTSELDFNIQLHQEPITLPEVVVTARDMRKWRQNLKTFKKAFLGNSANALETQIRNEKILDFQHHGEKLIATASAPLIIENKALGYLIEYNLEAFEATTEYVKYSGNPLFRELPAENESQRERRESNRLKAYNGSLRHFITVISNLYVNKYDQFKSQSQDGGPPQTALVGGSQMASVDLLLQEGFRTVLSFGIGERYKKEELVDINKLLSPASRNNELYLKFTGYLQVEYLLEKEPQAYLRDFGIQRFPGAQVSWLTLQADSIIIDVKGRYFERYMIQTSGYMAWERIADMLPFGYEPPGNGRLPK